MILGWASLFLCKAHRRNFCPSACMSVRSRHLLLLRAPVLFLNFFCPSIFKVEENLRTQTHQKASISPVLILRSLVIVSSYKVFCLSKKKKNFLFISSEKKKTLLSEAGIGTFYRGEKRFIPFFQIRISGHFWDAYHFIPSKILKGLTFLWTWRNKEKLSSRNVFTPKCMRC